MGKRAKRPEAEGTLLASVLLSAPGPIVLGAGLFLGRSSAQLADMVRRTAELGAVIVSYGMYRALGRGADAQRRRKLEGTANVAVGGAMCLSGAVMAAIALWAPPEKTGSVLMPLVIAALGLLTNAWLWLRYVRHGRGEPGSAILAAQARLYRAKSLVDLCVTAALAAVWAAPGSPLAQALDTGGSVAVSLYLCLSGLRTLGRDSFKKVGATETPRSDS